MRKLHLSSGPRIKRNGLLLLLLFALILTGNAQAQRVRRSNSAAAARKKASKAGEGFFQTQWWLGLKMGGNVTKAVPTGRHSIFVPTQAGMDDTYQKTYDGFGPVNSQIGLVGTYNFKKFLSISAQPVYVNQTFGYRNAYEWAGQANNSVRLTQRHTFKISYAEIPLSLRFDVVRHRFRPYVLAGGFYGRLLKADKHQEISSLDQASGAVNPIQNTTPVIGAQSLLLRSQWGWLAGGGISYDVGNIRVGLDATYKRGLNNVTDRKARYQDNRMTGSSDVLDDMKLRSLEVAFSVTFPMKFLELKSFRSVNP